MTPDDLMKSLLEINSIQNMAYPFGGLNHGPLAGREMLIGDLFRSISCVFTKSTVFINIGILVSVKTEPILNGIKEKIET